jgi:hypothetical protein
LIHGYGSGEDVPRIAVHRDEVTHLTAIGEFLSLTVAGKEDDDPVVLLDLLGQFVSENFEDVLPRGIVIQERDCIKSHIFEALLDRLGVIDGILEGRPFVIGIDADNNGVTLIIEAVEGRGGPWAYLNPAFGS